MEYIERYLNSWLLLLDNIWPDRAQVIVWWFAILLTFIVWIIQLYLLKIQLYLLKAQTIETKTFFYFKIQLTKLIYDSKIWMIVYLESLSYVRKFLMCATKVKSVIWYIMK